MNNNDDYDLPLDYLFDVVKDSSDSKIHALIIYDIVDNKKRHKLASFLEGYGFRVQKSAFEAKLTKLKYNKLLVELKKFVHKEDSIRIYKITNDSHITAYGYSNDQVIDDVIVI